MIPIIYNPIIRVSLTCTSSSLLLKWDTSTFSPSVTRVREMPSRPVALVYASHGRIRRIMTRIIFTRLKEGCIGPRNRFLASFATSIMLAPASPGKQWRSRNAMLSKVQMCTCNHAKHQWRALGIDTWLTFTELNHTCALLSLCSVLCSLLYPN